MKDKAKKPDAGKAGDSKKKPVYAIGKRKKAVAWASVRPGTGIVTCNSQLLEDVENESMRMLLREPLLIAGDSWKGLNISVKTKGGGFMGQAQAARQAVARGLAAVLGAGMKKAFMDYDRNLIVYDPRRTETHKPPRSSQGPRRYKQRSKR